MTVAEILMQQHFGPLKSRCFNLSAMSKSIVIVNIICTFFAPTLCSYLGGAFDVESLVEHLLGQLNGNQAILVNVYDVTNSSNPLVMYGHQDERGDTSLLHESKLDFGDPFRKHQMICRLVKSVAGLELTRCLSYYM